MRPISLAVGLLICSLSLNGQSKGQPIIDMHQHARFKVWLDAKGNPYPRLCFPAPCEQVPAEAKEGPDILKIALEEMAKYNVVKAVVSDGNLSDVYKWQAAAPDKFLAGSGFFSMEEADSRRIRKDLEDGKLQLMGEIGVQYNGIAPNHELLEPYYSLAEEFDVPVLIHCQGLGGGNPKFHLSAGNPLFLQEVLNRHPKLRIYLENAAWPYLEEVTALMYRYPNVYADVSTISWLIPEKTFYNYLKGLIDNGLEKRLMYGSDQMEYPEAIGIGIERIVKADFLSKKQKRDIFYNNAARFLRLSDQEIKAHHK